jgi:hypothetical protein
MSQLWWGHSEEGPLLEFVRPSVPEDSNLWFQIVRKPKWTHLYIPHWFIIAVAGLLAALPWLRWRFSLRTLLIGMTVVAVVLGLVIWAAGR